MQPPAVSLKMMKAQKPGPEREPEPELERDLRLVLVWDGDGTNPAVEVLFANTCKGSLMSMRWTNIRANIHRCIHSFTNRHPHTLVSRYEKPMCQWCPGSIANKLPISFQAEVPPCLAENVDLATVLFAYNVHRP